ncbi:MAG: HAMP domain-containing histidine kinase [Clostridia bacterium]|nr:HAMP domain-containing histidine kinase [Clostridia bacterium]
MKKLQSSRLVKTLCFLLCILFTAGIACNVVLGLLLTKSNLFYAEKEQLLEIAVEEIVEHYHQNDVRRYVMNVLSEEDQLNRDTELYQMKFSRERSNLSFTVTDEDGAVVLNNYPAVDMGYTFTKTLSIYDYDFDMTRLNEAVSQPEETTVPPETTETELSEELATEMTEPTAAVEQITSTEDTTTSPQEPTEPVSYDEPAYPTSGRTEHIYILDDNGSGYRFRYYYYENEYNEAILQYCTQLFETTAEDIPYAEYTDGWVTFREDDYAVSDNGVVYYRGEREPTTCILGAEQDYPHRDYTVLYTLPKTFTAKDLFYYAQKLTGYAFGYIHKIIPLTICFAVAALVFFILSLLCLGHVKGENAPQARGLHRIPYDIVCAVVLVAVIALAFFVIDDGPYSGPLPIAAALTALALILLSFLATTVVRIKAKTIGSNIFVVRFCRWLSKLIRNAAENKNLLLVLGITFGVVTLAEFIYSMLLYQEDEFIALLFIVKVIEIPLVLLGAINLHKVQNGAKRLAEGNLTEKVDTKYLIGPFKKNAEYLNAVNDGVNRAVHERMKSESMKTELITNVSHDLKTPLTSIINYVDLLKETDVQDEKAKEYIGVIDRQSQRLKKLCSDIVDASKAATGNLSVSLEPTALNVMLPQVIGEYDERLRTKQLQLVPAIPAETVTVNADGKLLWRVFDNLLNNVCKYAMAGTRVYLTLEQAAGTARITFRNISGSPLNISPEELTERFVRGDASRATEGSGLGLSIAKSLTELMGGRFDLAIDGDLFKVTVTFPILQA